MMVATKPVVTIRRLRWALVTGGVLLVGVLAGYIMYARYKVNHYLSDLKDRLGIHLSTETDHVTYSQTVQGRTVFTLHAAKQFQHADGKLTLHDVGIVLYGRNGDRADRIHGSEFEYDQKNGIMTGVGAVYIDLAPPPPADGKPRAGDAESRMIHLKTDGMMYRQKEQVATTDGHVEFMVHGMNGTAEGASYESQNGIIVLQSQVRVSGLRGAGGGEGKERPMVLTATHAEIDMEDGPAGSDGHQGGEAGNVAFLERAKLVEATEHGTETSSANHAVVHMSADGTPKHVDANGNVTLTGEGRGTVTSEKADLDLSQSGQPTAAHLMGVVRFTNDMEAKQEYGKADDARIAFDKEGRPVHALMTGNVEADLSAGANTRTLNGDRLDMALTGGGKEPTEVQEAIATARDGARMRLVDAAIHKDAKGKTKPAVMTTNVRADTLDAHFQTVARQTQLSTVDGTGRTLVERTLVDKLANGTTGAQVWTENGTGDVLRMDFSPDQTGKQSVLKRAEQRGSVRIVREAAARPDAKPGPSGAAPGPDVEHAEGDDAVFDQDENRMTMTANVGGQVRVSDPESALFANRVVFDQDSGDANAEGNVRVSYLQPGSTGEPVHVMSARAVAHKETKLSEFYSGAGGDARMWQGGSQVMAPVLEFDQGRKTVFAHGANGAQGQVVKTVLVNAGPGTGQQPGAKPGTKPSDRKQGANAPVRVLSREMLYTDATREVLFRGLVQVNDQDGIVRAREATVYLVPKGQTAGAGGEHPTARGEAARDGASGSAMDLGGSVDHIIATGAVEVEQPGRKATGERLVYTRSDDTSVMTGTATVPAKMVDQTQGMVTGSSLRFRRGDDSVEVLSGDGSEKVKTVTRVKAKD
jgi:lipopolysaccharide export system protein LptA